RWDHLAFTFNEELYGGRNADQTFNDLWKFSPETFSWKKVEPKGKRPPETYGMCCCMLGDRVIFFGGYKGNSIRAYDLLILD
ncbi:hypothetical protein IEQ44_16400, partial [Nocardioides sp. Y6]